MYKRSPLFLVVLASVSLFGTHHARADQTPSEGSSVESTASENDDDNTVDADDENANDDTMAVADLAATQSCVDGGICVGMYAKVTSGDFVGQEGSVVG